MEYQDIRYTAEPPNAILTIDRPERLNAFRGRTVEELIHAFHRAWTDPEVRCAILTGAGERAFCVGGDQKEYVDEIADSVQPEDAEQPRDQQNERHLQQHLASRT